MTQFNDAEIIGLAPFKGVIRDLRDLARERQVRIAAGLPPGLTPSAHMVFTGGPGTGKSLAAAILAKVAQEIGLIGGGKLTQCGPADLIAGYVGQTRIKTRELCERASGGVLFIDEAYALGPSRDGQRSFGSEAVDELIAWMSERRQDLLVIFSGYKDQMDEFLDRTNPGLRLRIGFVVDFPDYSADEVVLIAHVIARGMGERLAPSCDDVIRRVMAEIQRRDEGIGRAFGNTRELEKLLQGSIVARSRRLFRGEGSPAPTREELTTILPEDIANAWRSAGWEG